MLGLWYGIRVPVMQHAPRHLSTLGRQLLHSVLRSLQLLVLMSGRPMWIRGDRALEGMKGGGLEERQHSHSIAA